MPHDDHFHCYDHAGAGPFAHLRTDTFRRGTPSPGITFYSMTKDLDMLASRFTGIAVKSSLGRTPGPFGGRDIWMLRVGTPGPGKPKILFVGGQHAREWIAVEYTYLLAEWLVDNYPGTVAGRTREQQWAKRLCEQAVIYFVPMANPDGHEYTVTTFRMWRKNSPAGDPDFQRAPGAAAVGRQGGAQLSVDINRNYHTANRAAVIASGAGRFSMNPDDDDYPGPAAGSSFEASALETLMTAEKFDVVVDHHAHGCFLLHSPTDTDSPLPGPIAPRYTAFTTEMQALLNGRAAVVPTTRPSPPDNWQVSQWTYTLPPFSLSTRDALLPGAMRDFAFYLPRPGARFKALCLCFELPPEHYAGNPGFTLREAQIRPVFSALLGTSLALIQHALHPAPTAADFAPFATLP